MTKAQVETKLVETVGQVAKEEKAEKVQTISLKEIIIDLELDYEKKAKQVRQQLRKYKAEIVATQNHLHKSRYEFDVKAAKEVETFIKEKFIDKKKASKKETKVNDKVTVIEDKPKKKATKKAPAKKTVAKKTTKKAGDK